MPLGQIENGVGQNHYGLIPIPMAALATGDTPPDPVAVGNFDGYSYDLADDSDFTYVVPDDYLDGTVMTLHIRWACNETYVAANGEIQWRAVYQTVADDQTQAVNAGTTAQVDSGDINIPATARYLTVTDLTMVAASFDAGDLVAVDIERIALVGGVNPTADAEIYGVTVRYTRVYPTYIR